MTFIRRKGSVYKVYFAGNPELQYVMFYVAQDFLQRS